MTGLLLLKIVGHIFCMILVVYLGHGIFHTVSSFNFLQIIFWGQE